MIYETCYICSTLPPSLMEDVFTDAMLYSSAAKTVELGALQNKINQNLPHAKIILRSSFRHHEVRRKGV